MSVVKGSSVKLPEGRPSEKCFEKYEMVCTCESRLVGYICTPMEEIKEVSTGESVMIPKKLEHESVQNVDAEIEVAVQRTSGPLVKARITTTTYGSSQPDSRYLGVGERNSSKKSARGGNKTDSAKVLTTPDLPVTPITIQNKNTMKSDNFPLSRIRASQKSQTGSVKRQQFRQVSYMQELANMESSRLLSRTETFLGNPCSDFPHMRSFSPELDSCAQQRLPPSNILHCHQFQSTCAPCCPADQYICFSCPSITTICGFRPPSPTVTFTYNRCPPRFQSDCLTYLTSPSSPNPCSNPCPNPCSNPCSNHRPGCRYG
uniref:Uncharacterized protein n=1 Tax=Schistocephalus solidus TaxID=70667 RepID=A0A0V0JBX6_SCHSO